MVSPRLQFTAEDYERIERLTKVGEDELARSLAVQEVAGQPADLGSALKASILAINEAALPCGFATEDHPQYHKL